MKLPGKFNNAEENAYQKFFHQYNHHVSSYISRKIKKREDVKDVVQNVFTHLWEYRQAIYSGNAENIIFKTANQKISEFYKQHERQHFYEESTIDYADNSPLDLSSVKDKELLLTQLEASILLIIPPLRRRIFKMNKLEGITQKQISIQLNIPQRTVEHHISQAMMFLKNYHKNS
ncbi:sigma-70 family RNA polymerase sigma factor [Chryseobacterium sp. SIMBA_029]|uniref:sigma-70 family RNA polymerase sigma factor n=1 Tax=Chryseobacterium sp. SIMBA_029 TaxID=3085772 RepID=UPI00397D46E4